MKTAMIAVRVDEETKELLVRYAAEDRRSISSLLDKIIAGWLASQPQRLPARREK